MPKNLSMLNYRLITFLHTPWGKLFFIFIYFTFYLFIQNFVLDINFALAADNNAYGNNHNFMENKTPEVLYRSNELCAELKRYNNEIERYNNDNARYDRATHNSADYFGWGLLTGCFLGCFGGCFCESEVGCISCLKTIFRKY